MLHSFTVNAKPFKVEADPAMPLLWVLRDRLGFTGTKYGCGIGACGACTVHLNGDAVRSCSLPVSAAEDAVIVTIEGLSPDRSHPLQQAWLDKAVPQCGYCQSGMIMAAAALLKRTPKPTNDETDAGITNLCRGSTYPRMRAAIRSVAAKR